MWRTFRSIQPPIKAKEIFSVKEVLHTPSGDTVLDFGQNLTGWVEFDCRIPAGKGIRLTASEIMQDQEFYHENLRTAKTEFLYLSDGKEAHVRPHFYLLRISLYEGGSGSGSSQWRRRNITF